MPTIRRHAGRKEVGPADGRGHYSVDPFGTGGYWGCDYRENHSARLRRRRTLRQSEALERGDWSGRNPAAQILIASLVGSGSCQRSVPGFAAVESAGDGAIGVSTAALAQCSQFTLTLFFTDQAPLTMPFAQRLPTLRW